MKPIFFLIALFSFNVSANPIEREFEKFFNVPMPEIKDNGSIYIIPKDSDVLPVTDIKARITVVVNVKKLSKLLILHGSNKYPDNVCKSKNKTTFVASYNFNPDDNVSKNITTFRVDCSSDIIVWAKTKDGKFYKTQKPMRVFHFHRTQ